MSTSSFSRLFSAITFCIVLAACSTPDRVETQKITLFFYSQVDLDNATFDLPIPVIRQIAKSEEAKDAALKALFAGPSKEEQQLGALTSEDLTALADHYLGVSMEENIAVVNFDSASLEILNSAAARQLMAKSPIEETLMQFPDVQEVQYAIDGEVFTEWDA